MKNIVLGIATVAMVILLVMKLLQPSIQGKWVATQVIDNQSDTLKINNGEIQLDIEDNRYAFISTLNRTEAGTIRRKGNHLIVQNEGSEPYKMEISNITNNDLILIMQVENTPRKIIMQRQIK